MGSPPEMINEASLQRLMLALCWLGPLVGLLSGMAWAKLAKHALGEGVRRGVVLGLLGPLVWLLWHGFEWVTRFAPGPTPEQDYFGLERVDVLLALVVAFAALGVALGVLWRRLGPWLTGTTLEDGPPAETEQG